MWPVIIWTAVVSLSIGFVMGATFRQYRPIKKDKASCICCTGAGAKWGFMKGGMAGKMHEGTAPPEVGKLNPMNVAVIQYDRIWYGDKPPGWAVAKEVKEGPEINQTFHVQGADSVRAAVGTRSPVGHQYPLNGDRRNWTS